MTKSAKLTALEDEHDRLYFKFLILGKEIRELRIKEIVATPQNRVDREVRENWNLTLGILKKVGFISSTKWTEVSDQDKRPAYAFHLVRRDVRTAIARSLGIKSEKKVK